mgnify:CR=1 FL=1
MRVLITSPPAYIKNPDKHYVQAGSRWSFSMDIPKKGGQKDHYLPYPFFLGYTTSLLKQNSNVVVKALDPCALDYDENDFKNAIQSFSPDLILVEVPTISFTLVMDILAEIKNDIGCKVALSGGHVTALTEEVMRTYSFIDYCLIAEYELTFIELINNLQKVNNSKKLKAIKGLAFREGGKICINERRDFLMNLDDLPFPERDDLPIEHYHDFEIFGKPSAQMLTSRGCSSNCTFCMERQVMYASPLYRKRSPKNIISEMNLMKDKYGAKQIYFDDETMAMHRNHITAICNEIIQNSFDMPWTCMGDITLRYDTLKLMNAAGCVGIKFGVETIHKGTLHNVQKDFMNIEKVKQFVKWCKKLGIWTHATYIVGLPGENAKEIQQTLKFSRNLNNDSAQFSIATPYPGTPFYEKAKAEGWLTTEDWNMYDGANQSVVNYPDLSKVEIEELHKNAVKEYYRKAIIRGLVNPRRIFRLMQAGSLKYAWNKVLNSQRK